MNFKDPHISALILIGELSLTIVSLQKAVEEREQNAITLKGLVEQAEAERDNLRRELVQLRETA